MIEGANFLWGAGRGCWGSRMHIGSDEGALQFEEGQCDLFKIVTGVSKEVHGPCHVVLCWVFEVGGLGGEGQKVPVALSQCCGKHHAVGWVRIIDGVDVGLER